MIIEKDSIVTFDYKVSLTESGEMVDQSEGSEPLKYVHESGQIIPGLEKALAGLSEGKEINVTIEPEEAYGTALQENILRIPHGDLPADMPKEEGVTLQMQTDGNIFNGVIVSVESDVVVADFNHPLAGKSLDFWVRVVKVEGPAESN